MASIRSHKRSPFWYLRKKTFEGKWTESCTGYRTDNADDTRKARRLAEKATIKERDEWGDQRGNSFRAWVPAYLASRYRLKSAATLRRSEIVWSTIRTFLESKGLFFPRQIKYQHAEEYLRWRINRTVNLRPAHHNTARMELKFFSMLMGEAMRRELIEGNPFQNMIVPKATQKLKKALSDDDISNARKALKKQAPWMETVFEIMLWTGCRFNESSIPIQHVDLENNNLTLTDSKRDHNDPRRFFTIPLPPALRSRLIQLRDSGATKTVELTSEKNWRFNRFLKSCTGATSHSLRVTFITRCHQSGLSERQAMRLVNHSSKAIHDVYSRLEVEDVREAQMRIAIPSANGLHAEPTTP